MLSHCELVALLGRSPELAGRVESLARAWDMTLDDVVRVLLTCGLRAVESQLEPVGPFHDDVLEDGYRSCDYCFESAAHDIWRGLEESRWRRFFVSRDHARLSICEQCIERHFSDDYSSLADAALCAFVPLCEP